jgi:aspartate aminotransferase-like enzyme
VSTLQEEREHLAKADQHIADGNRRVTEQILRIKEMEGRGEDTQRAREMLQTLEAALTQMRRHRQLILDQIARLTVP